MLVIALCTPEKLQIYELPIIFCFISVYHWGKSFWISHSCLFLTSVVKATESHIQCYSSDCWVQEGRGP